MRILVTGINSPQVGKRPRLNYLSSVLAVIPCLQAAGHEVENRPVVFGENLDQFDKVVLFLAPVTGFVATHALNACWAYRAAKNRVVISYDDWQIPPISSSIKNFLARKDKIMTENPFGYSCIDEARKQLGIVYEALGLLEGNWPNRAIVPCYSGGDLSKLKIPVKLEQIKTYNPAVLFKGIYGWCDKVPLKTNKWILAALHDHSTWLKRQKLTWPIEQYGKKKLGQEKLPEAELFKKYEPARGVLSPKYDICGSGWWRARHGFSADSLSILAGCPEELAMIGPAYKYSPAEVEAMDEKQLDDVACRQSYEFYASAGTEEHLVDTINSAVCG